MYWINTDLSLNVLNVLNIGIQISHSHHFVGYYHSRNEWLQLICCSKPRTHIRFWTAFKKQEYKHMKSNHKLFLIACLIVGMMYFTAKPPYQYSLSICPCSFRSFTPPFCRDSYTPLTLYINMSQLTLSTLAGWWWEVQPCLSSPRQIYTHCRISTYGLEHTLNPRFLKAYLLSLWILKIHKIWHIQNHCLDCLIGKGNNAVVPCFNPTDETYQLFIMFSCVGSCW